MVPHSQAGGLPVGKDVSEEKSLVVGRAVLMALGMGLQAEGTRVLNRDPLVCSSRASAHLLLERPVGVRLKVNTVKVRVLVCRIIHCFKVLIPKPLRQGLVVLLLFTKVAQTLKLMPTHL